MQLFPEVWLFFAEFCFFEVSLVTDRFFYLVTLLSNVLNILVLGLYVCNLSCLEA